MKKIIAILLLAGLILSLTSCGKTDSSSSIAFASKEEQKRFDEACELMEQERYGEAMDAFASIPLYDAIWGKLNEINRLTGPSTSNSLIGKWYDLNDPQKGCYLEFSESGKVIWGFTSDAGETALPCSFEDDSVYITNPSSQITYRLKIVEIDGTTHITGAMFGRTEYDFVPVDSYATFKPIEIEEPMVIELTEENWADYFEIRPWENTSKDKWGEITGHQIGYAFCLKDEYADKLIEGSVAFDLKANGSINTLDGNDEKQFYEEVLCADWYSNLWYGNGVVHFPNDVSTGELVGYWQLTLADYRVIAGGSITLQPFDYSAGTDSSIDLPSAETDSNLDVIESSITVPELTGYSMSNAIKRLKSNNLQYKVIYEDSAEPIDSVVNQSPYPGEEVPVYSVITLYCSNGSQHKNP